MNSPPPCVIHEDEHLLVVAKPAGWNTHAPDEYAGEGIYEWLRDREPRWADLAIMHRLDRDTSGVLVFALSAAARRSLSQQFAAHEVEKRYLLLTAGRAPAAAFTAEATLSRRGNLYVADARDAAGEQAITRFAPAPLPGGLPPGLQAVFAEPVTGRTHQIRVQAAQHGFPVFGDKLYGGAAAPRLHLHAGRIGFRHPGSSEPVSFEVPENFAVPAADSRRAAVIDAMETDAFRLLHGAADEWPGVRVDRLGEWLLHQAEQPPAAVELVRLQSHAARGVLHRTQSRQVRRLDVAEASPQLLTGEAPPARFTVRENAIAYELSVEEGYSTGLFLDQRDNRRRLLTGHVAAGFTLKATTLLNVFAYTCAFSVCAAKAGVTTTSLDLSKKYLDWGRRNFALNGIDPAAHDFIYGDAFDWLRRLAKKGRQFDAVILDPPTFSQSKSQGVFRAEADFGQLVTAALPLLAPGGVLLAATNAARLAPADFMATLTEAIQGAGRRIEQQHYTPQPPDFPITPDEPGHLKAAWLRVR